LLVCQQTWQATSQLALKQTGVVSNKKAFSRRGRMNIALTNSKGGVGKSTLAVHLAVWLSEQGKRIAVVDAAG
jgi:Mrp family chromosome partitioning ATPase